MKTFNIMLVAVLALILLAAPLIMAEDNASDTDDDSSDAIELYDDTSDLEEGMVISPAPEDGSDDEADDAEETEAELGMDESASNAKIFWKQIGVWFVFGQEKKAEAELQIAKLRLIQAKIAAKNNDSAAVEKALEAHERIMERIKERINKIENASTEEEINATVEKLVGLERAIQVHERRIAYLSGLLENSNLTEDQRAKIEAKIEHAENVTAHLEAVQQRISEKQEMREERKANKTGNTEEEIEDESEEENETEIEDEDEEQESETDDDSSNNETGNNGADGSNDETGADDSDAEDEEENESEED